MDVDQRLREALDAHQKLLYAHLDIWKSIQAENAADSGAALAAKKCQERTEHMIQQCKEANKSSSVNGTGKVNNKHKRSVDTTDHQQQSKKAKTVQELDKSSVTEVSAGFAQSRVPVTNDPSGLFQIDSNPDDVSTLLKNAQEQEELRLKSQRKRKYKDTPEVDQTVPSRSDQGSEYEPSSASQKRPKQTKPARDVPKPTVSSNYDQTFEQRVALRLREKDEERKKKANKKRKRESDVSLEEEGTDSEQQAGKQPQNQTTTLPTEVDAATTSTKKTKKKKNKGKNIQDAEPVDSEQNEQQQQQQQQGQPQKPKKKKRKKSA